MLRMAHIAQGGLIVMKLSDKLMPSLSTLTVPSTFSFTKRGTLFPDSSMVFESSGNHACTFSFTALAQEVPVYPGKHWHTGTLFRTHCPFPLQSFGHVSKRREGWLRAGHRAYETSSDGW